MTIGVKSYVHTQSVASMTWTVNHNLGIKPVGDVTVMHEGVMNKILPAKVTHVTDNTMLIEFSIPRTGVARLIGV